MPWAFTSTVVCSVAFEALFTTAALSPLDGVVAVGVVAAGEEEPDLLELPQAATASERTSVGSRNFTVERIWTPSVSGSGRVPSQRDR
jgi:hypothetical protein